MRTVSVTSVLAHLISRFIGLVLTHAYGLSPDNSTVTSKAAYKATYVISAHMSLCFREYLLDLPVM